MRGRFRRGRGGPPPPGGGGGGAPRGPRRPAAGAGAAGDGLGPAELARLGVDLQRLPRDLLAAARQGGLPPSVARAYLKLANSSVLQALMCRFPALRDRLLADPRFLFKVGVDATANLASTATLASRGGRRAEWDAFFVADAVFGTLLNCLVVGLLAPVAVLGAGARAGPGQGVAAAYRKFRRPLPTAAFEPAVTGLREFTAQQRLVSVLLRAIELGAIGLAVGTVGQAAAHAAQMVGWWKRGGAPSDVALAPWGENALGWGLAAGVAANFRYQAVAGLETAVERSVGRAFPVLPWLAPIFFRTVNAAANHAEEDL